MRHFLGFFLSLCALSFGVGIARADIAPPPPPNVFEITDGYLWGEGATPTHLIHPSPKPYRLTTGNEFSMSFDLKPVDSAKNLCTRKEETPCMLTVEVIGKAEGKKVVLPIWKQDVEFDGTVSWMLGGAKMPRKLDDGPAVIRFQIMKEKQLLFTTDVPIKIW